MPRYQTEQFRSRAHKLVDIICRRISDVASLGLSVVSCVVTSDQTVTRTSSMMTDTMVEVLWPLRAMPYYPHRRTNDGFYISICPRCFATVARSIAETELADYDKDHIYDLASMANPDHFTVSSEDKAVQSSQGSCP